MSLLSVQKVIGMLLGASVLIATAEAMSLPSGRGLFAARAILLAGWLFPVLMVVAFAYVGLRFWHRRIGVGSELGETRPDEAERWDRIQLIFAAVAALGAAIIAVETWEARRLGARAVHDVLRHDLGMPIWMGVYLVTVTAMSFAFALGILGRLSRFDSRKWAGVRINYVVAFLGGLVVWLLLVDSLGAFVVGRTVIFATGGW